MRKVDAYLTADAIMLDIYDTVDAGGIGQFLDLTVTKPSSRGYTHLLRGEWVSKNDAQTYVHEQIMAQRKAGAPKFGYRKYMGKAKDEAS